MIIGNGKRNQFRYLKDINIVVRKIIKEIPKNSAFLHFGDTSDKKKPDVGYVYELIKKYRPDIIIYMIQIKKAKSWGTPKFIKNVYWHTDYTKKCKYGGIINDKPCSNTKKWINIHKKIGIKNVFILGGGNITFDEYKLVKKLKINYTYFPMERRFNGDGKTKIIDKDNLFMKIGITYGKII
tara:strand:- start:94 stop:639 length:546 start_codon:yes stop_codon:yes gene_type:complete